MRRARGTLTDMHQCACSGLLAHHYECNLITGAAPYLAKRIYEYSQPDLVFGTNLSAAQPAVSICVNEWLQLTGPLNGIGNAHFPAANKTSHEAVQDPVSFMEILTTIHVIQQDHRRIRRLS